MTVATNGLTVLSLAQSASDNGVWDKANASQDPTQDASPAWNGYPNQANQSSNNVNGVEFEDDATIDATTPKIIHAKILMTTPTTIDESIAKGYWYEIGQGANGGTWTYDYYLVGLYAGSYPLLRTWRVIAIDPNEVAWRDAETGTVALGTTDYYAIIADTDTTSKTDNVLHARLDYLTYGGGLTYTGTGGDFTDFLTFDFEDATSTGRQGIIVPIGGKEVEVNGVLTIGTATATTFNDSGSVLTFPHHLVGEGFSGIDVGMSNASQDIDFIGNNWIGLGNSSTKIFFDSELDVDGTNEEIDIIAHPFSTGDLVTYSDEGGTAVTGLTDATQYFVRSVTVDSIALYAVGASVGRQNSFTDTTRVGMTAAGTGENHSLIRDPDTRPDHTVTGTTGVGVDWTACTIDGCRVLTLTSKAAITGGFIKNIGNIVTSTGTMDGVSISAQTTTEGVGLIDTDDLDLITGCTLTAGDEGHAITTTTAASDGWDNTLSGYWTPADTGWNFSTAQAFTSEQLNTDAAHGFTTGDAVYYNDEGGVQTIGLTDGNKYYVNVVDTDTVTVHLTKSAAIAGSSAVNLTTSGSETHSLYSSKAAVFNNTSSGTLTIGVTAGTAPSFRNASGATTVVTATVTLTVQVTDADGNAVEGVRVRIEKVSDGSLITQGTTNASGVYSDATYEYVSDLAVLTKSRLKGYSFPRSEGTITANGIDVGVSLNDDDIVDLP